MVPGWSKGNHREIRGVPRDSVLLQVGRSLEGPSSSRGTQRVPVDPDASRRLMGVLGGPSKYWDVGMQWLREPNYLFLISVQVVISSKQ